LFRPRFEFTLRVVHLDLGEMAMRQVFLSVLLFSPVPIISAIFHIHAGADTVSPVETAVLKYSALPRRYYYGAHIAFRTFVWHLMCWFLCGNT
jgi:hypothetical protein